MDIRGYEKKKADTCITDIQRISNGYRYGYGADIYPANRVWGSYYLYPTRPVDIPNLVL